MIIGEEKVTMTIREFLKRHADPQDSLHPMNVVDFDLTDKIMHGFVVMPDVVRRESLAHTVIQSGCIIDEDLARPLDARRGTSEYLLMTEAGSITNWHRDFSGTAVYYLLRSGRKIFYLIRPTKHNLALFDKWVDATSVRNWV